jgi:hypothetical protein
LFGIDPTSKSKTEPEQLLVEQDGGPGDNLSEIKLDGKDPPSRRGVTYGSILLTYTLT